MCCLLAVSIYTTHYMLFKFNLFYVCMSRFNNTCMVLHGLGRDVSVQHKYRLFISMNILHKTPIYVVVSGTTKINNSFSQQSVISYYVCVLAFTVFDSIRKQYKYTLILLAFHENLHFSFIYLNVISGWLTVNQHRTYYVSVSIDCCLYGDYTFF